MVLMNCFILHLVFQTLEAVCQRRGKYYLTKICHFFIRLKSRHYRGSRLVLEHIDVSLKAYFSNRL